MIQPARTGGFTQQAAIPQAVAVMRLRRSTPAPQRRSGQILKDIAGRGDWV